MKERIIREICEQCVDRWGVQLQFEMAIEECAELIQAIQKIKRAKTTDDYENAKQMVIEELVDAKLMLTQLEYIIIDILQLEWEYEDMLDQKIEHIRGLLNK